MHRSPARRAPLLVALLVTLVLAVLAAVVEVPAGTGRAAAAALVGRAVETPANPLAARPWGVYTGGADGVYPAWQRAKGARKQLLAKAALRPRVRWFGSWIPATQVRAKIKDYVTTTQAEAGTPDVLVQLAVFRLWPQGEGAKDEPLTAADQAAYRRWVDQAAAGIGTARVAMVLEPDLGVALQGWRPSVRMKLTAYAAKKFGSLPNTHVYLDASSADWLTVPVARDLLLESGILHVRGFALGATHYSSLGSELLYGRQLVAALAAAGVPGRRFVVDTADNGRPFTWLEYWSKHPRGDFDNAEPCRAKAERKCNTLGVPPTARVAAKRWGLAPAQRTAARRHADAYLWFGRPWLYRQASPFQLERTLQVARTTPW
ncbi:glycoside hydrolase family 6 protein [Nocardioides caldifontis]|uniref:glycoside hydrolase family 6 protein n=1 Tax=Nocardioides caldifontis TaxID=2588938 RepID=UPI0011DF87A4|nr:glycoside hydrolase family 6 protein [Nocardioides caldifontis]